MTMLTLFRRSALQLNEKLAQFERDTSVQIVIAVFPKMETDPSIEEYTRRWREPGTSAKRKPRMARCFSFLSRITRC